MKNTVMLIGGIIVVLIPGGLTIMFIWALVFPKQRNLILNFIKRKKGDLKMAMLRIVGKSTPEDRKYVMKVDAAGIDSSRIDSANKAFSYVEAKHQERMTTFTPALMVGMFGIGAALIATLWILSSYFPITG
jgi:UPF0716 family protein affecting phage T7 exclusion